METDYLCACIAIDQIPSHPDWALLSYPTLLEQISLNTEYSKLNEIVTFWRHLQVWVRLLDIEKSGVDAFPNLELDYMLTDFKLTNGQQLVEQISDNAKTVCTYIDQFMQNRTIKSFNDVEDWEEKAITWQ